MKHLDFHLNNSDWAVRALVIFENDKNGVHRFCKPNLAKREVALWAIYPILIKFVFYIKHVYGMTDSNKMMVQLLIIHVPKQGNWLSPLGITFSVYKQLITAS